MGAFTLIVLILVIVAIVLGIIQRNWAVVCLGAAVALLAFAGRGLG